MTRQPSSGGWLSTGPEGDSRLATRGFGATAWVFGEVSQAGKISAVQSRTGRVTFRGVQAGRQSRSYVSGESLDT
jgi:hypothetical protein